MYTSAENTGRGVQKNADLDLGVVKDQRTGEEARMWFHWDDAAGGSQRLVAVAA